MISSIKIFNLKRIVKQSLRLIHFPQVFQNMLLNELHRLIGENFPKSPTIAMNFNNLLQSDQAKMDICAKSNENSEIILVVIDQSVRKYPRTVFVTQKKISKNNVNLYWFFSHEGNRTQKVCQNCEGAIIQVFLLQRYSLVDRRSTGKCEDIR